MFAAAGLFVGGVALPSAQAADLGGDCCADLEERVAELEATTARKGNRRVSLVISGQVNRAMMYWDDGKDTGLFSVDNSVSRTGFQFDGSARINPNLTAGFQISMALSAGARSHHVRQTDDDGYPSNFAGAGGVTQNTNTGVTTGSPAIPGTGTLSLQQSLPSTGFAAADGTLGLELMNFYVDHKQLGRLTVGRLNTATAGVTSVDLGGSGVTAGANFGLWNNSMYINFQGEATAATWNTVFGGSIVSIAGLSRGEGMRYDTPTFAGFSLSASFQEGAGSSNIEKGAWDLAARYAGEFAGFRVAAAIGYCVDCGFVNDVSDGGNGAAFTTSTTPVPTTGSIAGIESADVRQTKGSASVLHVASGLFLTGAAYQLSYNGPTVGENNLHSKGGLTAGENRPDTTFWYLNGGITKNWTGLGNTVLYGEYGRIDDGAAGTVVKFDGATSFSVVSSEASFWGIGIVQNIDAAAMELYLAYRNYSANVTGFIGTEKNSFDADDLSVVMSGARIRF